MWKKRWEYCRRHYKDRHDKYQEQLDYSTRQDQWSRSPGRPPKDKNDPFTGREVNRKIVRMVADLMEAPRNILTTPTNVHDSDPMGAEQAKFAIEHVLRSTRYGFDTYLERGCISAAAAMEGYVVIEWDDRIHDFALRNCDPRRFMLAPKTFDVWESRLPYAIEQVVMDLAEAREAFGDDTIVADLKGTDLEWPVRGLNSPDPENREPKENAEDEGSVLVLVCWSQFDKSQGKRALPPIENEPQICTQCGWISPPEADSAGDTYAPGAPEDSAGDAIAPGASQDSAGDALSAGGPVTTCPQCGAPIAPAVPEMEDFPIYPGGRRLEYIAPLQMKHLRDRGWPSRIVKGKLQQLRCPPYLQLRRFEHPTEGTGISETALDAPLQSLSNQLMERIRRQAQGPGKLITVTGVPLNLGNDNPWTPTDDPIQFVRFPNDPMAATNVGTVDLAMVSPALFQSVSMVQEQLRSDLGTFELSAQGAEDVKGVAVGTVEQAAQSGAVPTNHFIRIVNRQLGPWMGCVLDMCRIYWTEQRWIRMLGPFGKVAYELLAGEDFPEADFSVTADPGKKRMDAKMIAAVKEWYLTGAPPMGSPELRRSLANLYDIPASMVDDIESAEDALAKQLSEAGPGIPGDGSGTGGIPGGPGSPGDAGNPAGGGALPPMPAAFMAHGRAA